MYTNRDIAKVSKYLLARKQTIAVAESVTAGHLQAAISLADHAREFFQGGITAYNLGQKSRHLHTDPIHAEGHNSVSREVAVQMSVGVERLFNSDWGIGVTGYCTPVPEWNVEIPFAFFAISYHGKVRAWKKVTSRATNGRPTQEWYVRQVMAAFDKLIAGR